MQYFPTVLNQLIAWLSSIAILALSLLFFGVSQYAYPHLSRCLSLWNHNAVKGIAELLLLKPEQIGKLIADIARIRIFILFVNKQESLVINYKKDYL